VKHVKIGVRIFKLYAEFATVSSGAIPLMNSTIRQLQFDRWPWTPSGPDLSSASLGSVDYSQGSKLVCDANLSTLEQKIVRSHDIVKDKFTEAELDFFVHSSLLDSTPYVQLGRRVA
jgi:hypothetical protein